MSNIERLYGLLYEHSQYGKRERELYQTCNIQNKNTKIIKSKTKPKRKKTKILTQ